MSSVFNKTEDFLKEIDMHPMQTNIAQTMVDIMSEMKNGLRGEASSITMIPTYISVNAKPIDDESIIVADAGGTNLRIGLCVYKNGRPQFSDIRKYPIPGAEKKLSSDEFFSELAEKILPYTNDSSRIAFCFSYPAEIFPDRDGKILSLNKELHVSGAVGKVVGASLKDKLAERGVDKEFTFTLLNDSTASLMGGIATIENLGYDGIAGLVLGTGSNTCCFEKGENIKKIAGANDMIINCESGSYSGAFRGKADLMTDQASEIPGDHLLEKMISGAYMGSVITNTAILASQEGLLSKNLLDQSLPFTLPELDEFVRGKDNRISEICVGDDNEIMRHIIDSVYERAAKLVCANLAALCVHADGGKFENNPFCVIAEGSTFYNSFLFYDKLKEYINSYIQGEMQRYLVCRHAGNSTLAGAALSVFTS